jgi:DNA repair protein RadC
MTTSYEQPRLDIFEIAAQLEPAVPRRARQCATMPERKLREALVAYRLDLPTLRLLASEGGDIRCAIRSGSELPAELATLLDLLAALLRPSPREQVKSPADVAALLMVEMSHLDQEELRVVLLDTKNRIQRIETVYRGSLNTSMVRVGEVYKAAIRLNSAALIVVHNHPSGDPTPSPEDVLVTRQIVEAGALFDVEALDHLVIGQGRYVSMREKGLGFTR